MKKHTLKSLLLEVLTEKKTNAKSLVTYVWEEKISNKILKDIIADKFVEDLTAKDIKMFFAKVRFKNNGELISNQYLKELKSLFVSVSDKALEEHYILSNPMYHIKLPVGHEVEPTERNIDDETLKMLLEVTAKNERFRIILLMLLCTGLRIGELLALKWSDVDFENSIIKVRHSISAKYVEVDDEIINQGLKIGSTKTKSSVRDVPVNVDVMDLLNQQNEYLQARKIECSLNLIFPNNLGEIMNENSLRKQLMAFLKRNNVDCYAVFHRLRHTYATQMLDADVGINVISKLLGHKSIVTTADTYAKVNLKPKLRAVQKHYKFVQKKGFIA